MADINLTPRSALAPYLKLGTYGSHHGVPGAIIRELKDFTFVSLTAFKGQNATLSNLIKSKFGVELPKASKTESNNDITFISIAPNQWMVFRGQNSTSDFASELEALTSGIAAVVDQSDARAIVEISGSMVRELLSKGVSVDLHPLAFGVGDAATTLAVHLWITLWQTEQSPTFRIAVFRAFGSSLLDWLINSGAEFGCQVQD